MVVGPLLEGFIKALRFDSRIGPLQEAVLSRLTRGGDLGPDESTGSKRSAYEFDSAGVDTLRRPNEY